MVLHINDFETMEKRRRTALMNSLSGFKSVNLVSSISADGVSNLSIVSSVIHIGANPALMGFIMRPISVTRDTYNNIMETGTYTFNHIRPEFYKQAHQVAARYPSEVSEFEAVGLTPTFSESGLIKAPYVQESSIQIGLIFKEKYDIAINGTILMIGAVTELIFPDDCWMEDGYLDLEKAGTVTCSSLDSYHTTERLSRLSYAKPDRALREIPMD
ncbi:MAG: flavin reductase [Bacteroidota bacterium]